MDSAVCPGSLPAVPSLLCWTPSGLWGWMPPPVPVLFLLWAKLLTPAGCVGLALPLRLTGASPCWGWRTGPGRRSHGREDLGSCQAFLPSLARRVGTARALASALPTACQLLRNPGPQLPHSIVGEIRQGLSRAVKEACLGFLGLPRMATLSRESGRPSWGLSLPLHLGRGAELGLSFRK